MHALLIRQIRRHLGEPDCLPPGWQAFLQAVDAAYGQCEDDLKQVQRSMELMSAELTDRNRSLQEQLRERTAIEQALRESEHRLAKAHQVANIGNWVWDIQSDTITWSREVYSMFGVHPLTFEPNIANFMACVHPEDREAVASALRKSLNTGAPYHFDHRIVLADGTIRYISEQGELEYDDLGNAPRMFGTAHDITAHKLVEQALLKEKAEQAVLIKKLEEAHHQLLQSEKLASIGQLAAGVAHEINNPIGYVQSNLGTLNNYINDLFQIVAACETARMAAPSQHQAFQDLDGLIGKLDLPYLKEDIPALLRESKEGITRVRKIVQDLKDFSRLDSLPDWQLADLESGLESTLNIVQNEIKYKADVVKAYQPIPKVACLPSQLNQVFMNLMVNAAHAIDGKRGTITLHTGMRGDDQVFIEVVDDGKGIPPEIRNKIFDPFFTTKPVGKGTGLGLSLAYSIINKHHGHFEVDSEVGKGTTFRVVLPIQQPDTHPLS